MYGLLFTPLISVAFLEKDKKRSYDFYHTQLLICFFLCLRGFCYKISNKQTKNWTWEAELVKDKLRNATKTKIRHMMIAQNQLLQALFWSKSYDWLASLSSVFVQLSKPHFGPANNGILGNKWAAAKDRQLSGIV